MDKATLSSALVEKVSSMHDAAEVVRMFNEEYANLSAHARFGFRRLLLRAASEHSHTELRILLLERCLQSNNNSSEIINDPPCTHYGTTEYNTFQLLHCSDLLHHREGYERLFGCV